VEGDTGAGTQEKTSTGWGQGKNPRDKNGRSDGWLFLEGPNVGGGHAIGLISDFPRGTGSRVSISEFFKRKSHKGRISKFGI